MSEKYYLTSGSVAYSLDSETARKYKKGERVGTFDFTEVNRHGRLVTFGQDFNMKITTDKKWSKSSHFNPNGTIGHAVEVAPKIFELFPDDENEDY